MKTGIIITILLITIMNLTACINIYNPAPAATSNSPSTTPTTPATPTIPVKPIPVLSLVQFEDRSWLLEKYGKIDDLQNVIGSNIAIISVTIKFDSSSGKVSGSTGCNSYSAAYQRTMNKIAVGNISITKMNCPSVSISKQEIAFTDALIGAEDCKIVNDKLEINCTLNRILIFRPVSFK
jgi:heat shock protein HslJ